MAQYRKNPVIVEAHRWTKENIVDHASNPEWLKEARKNGDISVDPSFVTETMYDVRTKEGVDKAKLGDWFIYHDDHLSVCSNEDFERNYTEFPMQIGEAA